MSPVTLTVDTTPVKGHVIIRQNTAAGPILNQGTAPVSAAQEAAWVYYIQFGDVVGYSKPPDDSGMITSTRTLTYTYTSEAPPPEDAEVPVVNLAVIGGVVLGVVDVLLVLYAAAKQLSKRE